VPSSRDETISTLNATFCATLVDEWASLSLTDAVVCPGSRSTPLAIALLNDPRVRVHVHHDERSGSFMALGLARASRRPVLVLTTSGTAAAQLHAAVIEADLDHVSLIVATADRPPRLRGVGAPQTIDQIGLYTTATRLFIDADLPDPTNRSTWRGLARSVFESALGPNPGPVHLNLPFDEPLLGVADALPAPLAAAAGGTVEGLVGAAAIESVSLLAFPESGVVIAGSGIDDPSAVLALARSLQWPVIADPRSGCRIVDPTVVVHADALMRGDGPHLDTRMVLRFGSLPASKVVNQWIGSLDVEHVYVDATGAVNDPQGAVTRSLSMTASAFCEAVGVGSGGSRNGDWLALWRAADDAAERAMAEVLAEDGIATEPGTARSVVTAIPDGGTLVVSSSMPVRDVEWYPRARDGLAVFSNRGANGIDGVVSTAVGVALAGSPTALLIGDVAFLHDINGLLGADRRDVDLCIVVIDNDGGGIFSFLPQAQALAADDFETLFGTPHGVDLSALAHAHGLPVLEAADDEAVGLAVTATLAIGGVHVVVIHTDRGDNVAVHERLNLSALEAARSVGWTADRFRA
jgi:2-succinyl-5-enolpyruvyl-6-hydroxy-3-cyclohexene-1-carboxylate synthase